MDLLLIVIIVSVFLFIIFYFNSKLDNLTKNQKPADEIIQIISMLQNDRNMHLQSSKDDRKVLLESLQKNTTDINKRLDMAAKVIGDVQKNIGEMSEIGRSMKDLQEFLQSPKLRGNVGEQVLKELLAQMLPKQSFHLQYGFKSGERVDAAIQTTAGIIPIDSKFPMENFRKMTNSSESTGKKQYEKDFVKDVKKHIEAISKKYIIPEEGTIDYAIMYIPSEAIYYEIVNNLELFEYSSKLSVMPVSPSTFYAFIKAVMMSFEGQRIEARAKEILGVLKSIQKDYEKVEDNLSVLQKHINNAGNMMNSTVQSFGKLGQRIESTKLLEKTSENELSA